MLLVTHNVALIRPIADFFFAFGSDGAFISRRTVDDALAKDEALKHEVDEQAVIIEKTEMEVVDGEELDAESEQVDGKLIVEEVIQRGRIS